MHYWDVLVQKPREIAFRVLKARETGRDYVEDIFEQECDRQPLPPLDRRFIQEIVYGTVRWQGTLDWLIARNTQGRPQKPGLQIILRLGLYQLFWLDRVPDHAVVHETVEMTKEAGFGPQAGFVNALLRNSIRDREAILTTLRKMQQETTVDPAELARAWSHPQWLVARWLSRWGSASTRQFLQLNNTPPPTYVRVNTLKSDPGKILQRWREEDGVVYDFFIRDWAGENLTFLFKEHKPFAKMGTFFEGWFYVQDPSTLLAPCLLAPKPGETILDLCAAPGGKTTLMAQFMKNEGRIVAMDVSESRLALLRQNCTRLAAKCVETRLFKDAEMLPGPFDRALVDAPCSNTGVLRRRIDLRWRIRNEELARLAKAQGHLLDRAASALKVGGTLVYSTCSLEPEENQEVVRAFLERQPGFKLDYERELIPFQDGVDGAYAAAIIKHG